MRNLEDEIEDTLSPEEQQKIDSIQIVSFVQKEEPKPEPFSIWSIFGFNQINQNVNPIYIAGALGGNTTRKAPQFNIQRIVGLDKVVTINNISGKHAYLILTAAPIKTFSSFELGGGVAGIECHTNIGFEDKGEYKAQKLSIANNTRSEYDIDNNKFYCTLFFNIDGQWKKSWDNRRFNARKFDINILEKHVKAALEKDNIPDF
jgi:hypothetical protein